MQVDPGSRYRYGREHLRAGCVQQLVLQSTYVRRLEQHAPSVPLRVHSTLCQHNGGPLASAQTAECCKRTTARQPRSARSRIFSFLCAASWRTCSCVCNGNVTVILKIRVYTVRTMTLCFFDKLDVNQLESREPT